jgi:dipeptidyl-peptidase-3
MRSHNSVQRRYLSEQVGSIAIVSFYADGFEKLDLKQRILAYYLSQAAITGDEIYTDQISEYGIRLTKFLAHLVSHLHDIEPDLRTKITDYAKLVWMHHGNYDLDTYRKFIPDFTFEQLKAVILGGWKKGAGFGPWDKKRFNEELARLREPVFDPDYKPMLVVKNPEPGQDVISASSCNLYDNVTLQEADSLLEHYRLNSRIARVRGRIVEQPYRAGTSDGRIAAGRYAKQLRRMIFFIKSAMRYADPEQRAVLRKLVRFYRTGYEKDWLEYNIAWVKLNPTIDMISGFVETYMDPRSAKGSFETIVSFVDLESTKLMQRLAENADYFEMHAPWKDEYKKHYFRPPVANAINVLTATGDSGFFCPG